MEIRKKLVAFLLILSFILNSFSILNSFHVISPISDKMNTNNFQNTQLFKTDAYNYWYNYTIHKLNETGGLTGDLTPFQRKIIENVTLTYMYRENNYFNKHNTIILNTGKGGCGII